MSINVFSLETTQDSDTALHEIVAALRSYERDHPGSEIDVRRAGAFTIRIRVIDREFNGLGVFDRHAAVWRYLASLSEDYLNDIGTLLCLTPDEGLDSPAFREFDRSEPSKILASGLLCP